MEYGGCKRIVISKSVTEGKPCLCLESGLESTCSQRSDRTYRQHHGDPESYFPETRARSYMLPQKAPPSLALTCWNVIKRARPNFGTDTNANLQPVRLRVITLRSRNTILSYRPSTRSFAHSFKSWPVVRMCVLIRSDRLTVCVCVSKLYSS